MDVLSFPYTLLNIFVSGASLDVCAESGITPLSLCIKKGHTELARHLLDSSVPVDAMSIYNSLAYEQSAALTLLQQHGADMCSTCAEEGHAPLHLASVDDDR
jgi:ankyrin repeat protein